MKTIRAGTGFAVFVLFFGIALIEAFRDQKWLTGGFWVLMGLFFILADNLKSKKENID